jgi:hypothetical protein
LRLRRTGDSECRELMTRRVAQAGRPFSHDTAPGRAAVGPAVDPVTVWRFTGCRRVRGRPASRPVRYRSLRASLTLTFAGPTDQPDCTECAHLHSVVLIERRACEERWNTPGARFAFCSARGLIVTLWCKSLCRRNRCSCAWEWHGARAPRCGLENLNRLLAGVLLLVCTLSANFTAGCGRCRPAWVRRSGVYATQGDSAC